MCLYWLKRIVEKFLEREREPDLKRTNLGNFPIHQLGSWLMLGYFLGNLKVLESFVSVKAYRAVNKLSHSNKEKFCDLV